MADHLTTAIARDAQIARGVDAMLRQWAAEDRATTPTDTGPHYASMVAGEAARAERQRRMLRRMGRRDLLRGQHAS